MQMRPQRTHVYVDGFNLYYGSLRKTSYKWLDLKKLFTKLLGLQHNISAINYYTARINNRDENPDTAKRQQIYLVRPELPNYPSKQRGKAVKNSV